VDDLQGIADDYLKLRREEIARCEVIIAEKVKPLLEIKNIQPRMNTDGHGYKSQADPI
jgi:glutamyl-tRNA reductase